MPFKSKVQRKLYMRQYRAKKKLSDLDSFLKSIDGCQECQSTPVVFITSEKIPLCKRDWYVLADSDVCFTSDVVSATF